MSGMFLDCWRKERLLLGPSIHPKDYWVKLLESVLVPFQRFLMREEMQGVVLPHGDFRIFFFRFLS